MAPVGSLVCENRIRDPLDAAANRRWNLARRESLQRVSRDLQRAVRTALGERSEKRRYNAPSRLGADDRRPPFTVKIRRISGSDQWEK